MPINPKSLIPDVKECLQRLARIRAALPLIDPNFRSCVAVEVRELDDSLTFIGAALGDPQLLRQVCAWMPALARSIVDQVAAGRVPIVPEGGLGEPRTIQPDELCFECGRAHALHGLGGIQGHAFCVGNRSYRGEPK